MATPAVPVVKQMVAAWSWEVREARMSRERFLGFPAASNRYVPVTSLSSLPLEGVPKPGRDEAAIFWGSAASKIRYAFAAGTFICFEMKSIWLPSLSDARGAAMAPVETSSRHVIQKATLCSMVGPVIPRLRARIISASFDK